jgi:hypothetical protein
MMGEGHIDFATTGWVADAGYVVEVEIFDAGIWATAGEDVATMAARYRDLVEPHLC